MMLKSTCGRVKGGGFVQQMIKLASLGEEVLTEIMRTVLCGFSFSITLMSAMATQCVYMHSWSDGHTWRLNVCFQSNELGHFSM